MKKSDYPKYTVIMRGYTPEQADAIVSAMAGLESYFAVEVTLNSENALSIIKDLATKYGQTVNIGAGTVRTLADVKAAIAAGAKFLLGPHKFTEEMLHYCQARGIITVPAAMTTSEINEMVSLGADLIKIFPAATVTPRFFNDIQAPLGKLPLMAVGGVSQANCQEYFESGASYVGMGSGMFRPKDLAELNVAGFQESFKNYVAIAQKTNRK